MNPNFGDSDGSFEYENIEKFAQFIGINPEVEQHLMHIAEEGYLAKTPEPWVQELDSDNAP
jgi:pyruvate-formate lyase-activating enzyme